MRDVKIKYNPYRLETEVLIDDAAPKQNSKLNVGDRRLQEWVEELPTILFDECGSRDFNITFHGTLLDYEDMEAMARDAKSKGINIKLTHIPAKEVADKEAAIAEIFHAIQEGPFEELKQPDVVRAFELAKSSDFEVNVVATMSAGKSTLINALLQQKLMPSKQEACTATITEIKDTDAITFRAKAYNAQGDLIEDHEQLSIDIMNRLNSDPDVSKIRIEGNIPFVSSDDVSLVLVDTPGPNNSRDPEHKAATYRMLSESSKTLVLYILNATQLAVNDDYNLLRHVADSMKVGGKQSRDRFIFVVNKLDDFKKGEDSVEAAISKVREYLRDNGIENANIYPASALTALNIRTILAADGNDDDDEVYEAKGKVRKFINNEEMHFEKLAPLAPTTRGTIQTMLSQAEDIGDTKQQALIHCGIIPIELAIKTYVQKYAKTAKIKNIVDTFSKRLESANSFETTKRDIAENQDKQKEILANIEILKKKLNSGEEAKSFKSRISAINYDREIKAMADSVIVAAQQKITAQIAAGPEEMSRHEAEELCKQFTRFADNLQAEVQVKLEDVITEHVYKSAKKLLEEYQSKLSALTQDIAVGTVAIDPFDLMAGDISIDTDTLVRELTATKSVKVGEEWVKNTNKRWWKPWTWGQASGYYRSVYEDKEYVDGTSLAQKFFAPVQKALYSNSNSAVAYAKQQSENTKKAFSLKFEELDAVLKEKLRELEQCATDKKNVESRITESQARLAWLKDIQAKTKAILDI